MQAASRNLAVANGYNLDYAKSDFIDPASETRTCLWLQNTQTINAGVQAHLFVHPKCYRNQSYLLSTQETRFRREERRDDYTREDLQFNNIQ